MKQSRLSSSNNNSASTVRMCCGKEDLSARSKLYVYMKQGQPLASCSSSGNTVTMCSAKDDLSAASPLLEDMKQSKPLVSNSIPRNILNGYCEKGDLNPPSYLLEAPCLTGKYGIEISSSYFQQANSNFKPRFSGINSLKKTVSVYDSVGKQQPHPFKTTTKRTESSSCYVNGFATSLSYLLIILLCFLCYADQSYVATFGFGVVYEIPL